MRKRTRRPIRDRFEEKYQPEPMSGCWLWTAALDHKGYAFLSKGGREGPVHASRVAYELYVGPIPDGLYALHRCDVPACVNPAHLFLGTLADNNADMKAKGRNNQGAYWASKTHCKRGHPFDEANTYHSGGSRHCRACRHDNYVSRYYSS